MKLKKQSRKIDLGIIFFYIFLFFYFIDAFLITPYGILSGRAEEGNPLGAWLISEYGIWIIYLISPVIACNIWLIYKGIGRYNKSASIIYMGLSALLAVWAVSHNLNILRLI